MYEVPLRSIVRLAMIASSCLAMTACPATDGSKATPPDPPRKPTTARQVQPRLTGADAWRPCTELLRPGHVVEEAECSSPHPSPTSVSVEGEDCHDVTMDHAAALEALVGHPSCADAALERLERLARAGGEATAWSDVAAAYELRAQRDDRPADLLRAWDAAQSAVARAPRLLAARFNLALAQEELGLTAEAMTSWETLQRSDRSPWSTEAGEHRRRLAQELARRSATQWPLERQRLPEVALAGDRRAVAQLIAPFPAAAQRYLEEEVLPAWANASSLHRDDEARRQLELAEMVATELAAFTGDRYPLDATELVAVAARSPRQQGRLQALYQGYLAFAEARLADRALDRGRAADLYWQAQQAFRRVGSPMRLGAQLGRAVALSFHDETLAPSLLRLAAVEREADRLGYHGIWARVQSNTGFMLVYQGRLVEALSRYEAARGRFAQMKDGENLANVHARKIGILRTVGENELAWREAFQAQRYAAHVVEVQSRHHLLGETGAVALALGHPQVALLYQGAAVRLIEDELAKVPREDQQTIQGLRNNLAIARRARSGIYLRLERYEQAQHDLAEAMRLTTTGGEHADESIRRAIQARVQEVEGQRVRRSNPQRAIASFTQALALATPGEYHSFRANLLVQRAAVYRATGNKRAAERDWRTAIEELGVEEREIVRVQSGQGEAVWTAYFSRFQETYEELIGQLADEGRPAEAFAYAERARAFEPLSLVLQRGLVPKAFGALTEGGEPLQLRDIQAYLPAGTFLVEYRVLANRTLVWVITRDHFELVTAPVGRTTIDEWTASLQRDAEQRDVSAFEAGLDAPFAALVGPLLSRIERLPEARRADRRLVFVPDGAIHGLPIAALHDKASGRYLIEKFPVAVAASATLYVFSLLRDEALAADAPRALLVGDPAFDPRSELTRGLARLPRARTEVERIRAFYAPRVDVLVDRDATAPKFLELARRSTVIHLAGHALANPMMPFRSLLLFAPAKGHPGALYAEELLTQLWLGKARLVVLSACSSAGGHPVGPGGLSGLVRPLFAAGAPAVVGSLWNVGDAPTEELLVDFHRRYREGNDAASSLRLAQLDLLRQPTTGLRSVLAWAPFQIVGYASSPFPSPTPNARRDSP